MTSKKPTNIELEILGLRSEIERHNELYYQHAEPEISDYEFDQLLERLKTLEAEHPELITQDVLGVLGMFAVAGDPSFRYNLPGRPVFTLPLGLLAYAGMVVALARWRDYRPGYFVLPHPSWRTTAWERANPWFAAEALPELRAAIAAALS